MSQEQDIRAKWAQIDDPFRDGDIVASGRVSSLVIAKDTARFVLAIAPQEAKQMQQVLQQCEATAQEVAGIAKAQGTLTAHRDTPSQAPPPPTAKPSKAPNQEIPEVFQHIQSVIAIASGKGGVGKSTLATNLAAVFAQNAKIGLLDADIYGPSASVLLGVEDKPDVADDRKVIPVERFGIQTMSIGYMVPAEQAMVWRGPMVQSALMQMLTDVAWQPLDALVLDMPPGTGDVQLTIAQRVPVSGAVIITTPQGLALADVRRAVAMFRRVNVPILGVVENMSYITAPDGTRLTPFGAGGGERIAKELGLKLLAQLPLDESQHNANEAGVPLLHHAPKAELVQIYVALAEAIKAELRALRE